MNVDGTRSASLAAALLGRAPRRPPTARIGPGQRPTRRDGRPVAVWGLEVLLSAQAVLAAATAVVAAHQWLTAPDIVVMLHATIMGFVAVVVTALVAVPVILLHHRPGSSRRGGLPLAIIGQVLLALVSLYAWTHTDLLPADVVVLGLGGPAVAAALAALPASRRFAKASPADARGTAAAASAPADSTGSHP